MLGDLLVGVEVGRRVTLGVGRAALPATLPPHLRALVPAGLEARLRGAHLARLKGGGDLARLVARQGELQGVEEGMGRTGREHPELPDDLLNFHYDPLACAVAVGWDGARVEELELGAREEDGVLTFPEEPGGRKTRVVTDVDSPRFEEEWLRAVVPA